MKKRKSFLCNQSHPLSQPRGGGKHGNTQNTHTGNFMITTTVPWYQNVYSWMIAVFIHAVRKETRRVFPPLSSNRASFHESFLRNKGFTPLSKWRHNFDPAHFPVRETPSFTLTTKVVERGAFYTLLISFSFLSFPYPPPKDKTRSPSRSLPTRSPPPLQLLTFHLYTKHEKEKKNTHTK